MSQRRGGGGRGGGGGGGAASGGSRSLLSGKAKKEMMKEKREKDRIRAEKFAAWEKKQQATEEEQRNARMQHQQQQGRGSQDDDDDADGAEPQQQQREGGLPEQQSSTDSRAQEDDDDGALVHRRIQPVASSSTAASASSASSSAAGTAGQLETGGEFAVPAFAPLESSGVESRNKLRTLFAKESKEEVEKRKAESRKPLQRTGPMDGSCPSVDYYRELIDIPLRPAWSASTSAAELHAQESRSFSAWLSGIYSRYAAERLNHFEHNLEVWRQLWRVCEQSDLLLCIVDVRFPLINFPPSLYRYVTTQLGKGLLLVLNKIDLVPPRAVSAWREYFHRVYPLLHVVAYSSQPRGETGSNDNFDVSNRNKVKVGGGLVLGAAYGVQELMQRCRLVLQQTATGVSEELKAGFSFEPTAITQAEGEDTAADEKDGQREAESAGGEDENEVGDEDGGDEEQQEEERKKPRAGKQRGRGGRQRRDTRRAGGRDHGEQQEEEEDEQEDGAAGDEKEVAEAEQPTAAPPPAKYRALFGSLEDQQPASSLSSAALSASSAAFLTVGTIGCPNSGKCWAAGTLLRLYDGSVKAVETFVGGELLMGSDGQPRAVTPGSLTTGQAALYRIQPDWEGAQPFTVNGAHILVLTINSKPCVRKAKSGDYTHRLDCWEITTSNNMLRKRGQRFTSKAAADVELAQELQTWRPLIWELSVDDYRALPGYLQYRCKLYASRAVTFQPPRADALYLQLAALLGDVVPSAAQVEWAAWYLGVWLTDGLSASANISQGGPEPPDERSHQQVMDRLLEYQQLFGEAADRVDDHESSADNQAYFFQFGGRSNPPRTASIAHRLLLKYSLINNKHVPLAWLCDTLEVRRRIFAGVLDGDGYYAKDNNCYEVAVKRRHLADGFKTLAGSLGLRSSSAHPESCTNQETGEVYHGYRVSFSGDMWDVVQYCALTYMQCPAPGQPNSIAKRKDSRSYGFDIEPLPGQGAYYGFAVHGGVNQRILLGDFTVTHNSSLINSLCRRKLVSVSKTPGHTKYLQTIFLNRCTRLADCPGLVFPAVDMPKALQVLAGCFPIAQTRDPYSAVRLLAETVPLERVYKLRPTPLDERGEFTYGDGEDEAEAGRPRWQWTAWSICEAFAYQKGFRNRHGVLDLYRAANAICRDALEGRVVMFTTPPAAAQAASNGSSGNSGQATDGRKDRKESRQDTAAAEARPKQGKARLADGDQEQEQGQLTTGKKKGQQLQRRQQRYRRHSDDEDDDGDD